ncbi:MAG: methylmalonyl Co-A mutase-associated GTPase MeaB [Nitrososphaeria archaeon]
MSPEPSMVTQVLKGEHRAIAKAISAAENGSPEASTILKALYPRTGKALVVGITGPTGAGKSTLISHLISEHRRRGPTVGVIAIDPSSPFSGGAMLGDRIRMLGHSEDPGVYIRSMASRGVSGGISEATRDAVRVLDAAGIDVIFIETLGAGQSDVEVIEVAKLTVVVFTPMMGDEIQALKAGMMEIGDIFVVNKADLPGADRTVNDIESMIPERDGWKPAVIKTVGRTGEGVQMLMESVQQFVSFLDQSGHGTRRERMKAENEFRKALGREVSALVVQKLRETGSLHKIIESIRRKEIDADTAASRAVRDTLK